MSLKHRRFDPISIRAEHGRRRVHRIVCSAPGCDAAADISANTEGGSRAHEDILKIWRRAGWEVGNNPSRDLCPNCVMARRRRNAAAPSEADEMNAKVIPMPMHSQAAQQPRQPSFDDKRLINSKLEEVYIDDQSGYSAGWSDEAVAADLGVPRKWVEDLRAANFGPIRTNEEILAAIEAGRVLRDEAQKALADARREAAAMRQRADALEKAIPALADRFAEFERRLSEIERRAR